MGLVKFGDYVKEVKINIDRNNNPYEYYVAGDHMDSEDLTIRRKGLFATDDVGPAFTRLFKPGQILYGSRRTYLKKVAVADFEGICSNTTFVLETKDENKLRQRLLPFIMLTDDFTKWSISKSKGSTNPYILFSDLANYEFELPEINRQDELVDLLWQAYATKESYREMIRATDEMVKSQFIEMFGNPVTNPMGWSTKPLCQVAPESPSNTKMKGRVWVLNLDMIESNSGCIINKVFEDSDDLNSVAAFDEGNVLFSKLRPYLNKVTIPDGKGYATTELVPLRPHTDELRQYFLSFLLRTDEFVKYADGIATGTKMPRMPMTALREFKCILPPTELQDLFCGISKQADKSKFDGLKSQFIEMFGNQLEYQKSSHEKVRDYCDVVSGYPFNSELFNKDRQGSPLIRIRDVARGYTETYTTEVCDNRFEVNAGDLLVGMDGIFDIAPWASETALLNQRVCMVKPNNERVSAAFIKYAVHPVLKQIEGNTDATTVKHISAAQIADIRLPLINECKINEFTRVAQRADKSKYLS